MKNSNGLLIALGLLLLLILWKATKETTAEIGTDLTPEQRKRIAQKVKSLWWNDIKYFAALYKVPAKRVAAIVAQESGGELNAKGAGNDVGLMQITPIAIADVDQVLKLKETILDVQHNRSLSVWEFLTRDIYAAGRINYFDARTNLQYGTAFLSLLLDRTGNLDEATKRYNGSGPATDQYLKSVKEFETYF